jgi:hypothetical protein
MGQLDNAGAQQHDPLEQADDDLTWNYNMNRPLGQPLRRTWPVWVLALVFLFGLASGLLLARVSAFPAASDTLTRLALLFLGLGAGVLLVGAGWLLGIAGRRAEGPAAAELPPAPTQSWQPDDGYQPSPPPAAPPATRTVAQSEHIQALRDEDKLILRANNLLGYESLQVTVGITPGWFRRVTTPTERRQVARRFAAGVRSPEGAALGLFIAALAIYAFTRLFALDRFPINFFADEAFQVTNAIDLIQNGFRDAKGQFFPIYFKSGFVVNPNISVYLHVLTMSLFGKSIIVARGTSALLAVIAAAALAFAFKGVFRARHWWAVVLLMGIMPTWFLFSRTTFDTVAMSSFYVLFIVFYLLYRYRSPRYLYLALIFGIVTFYAYPSGQPAIGLLALFLLISDLRYHLQQRRTLLWAVPLLALGILPFIGFQQAHPGQMTYHLQAINSFWIADIPLGEKLLRSGTIYLRLLSPGYWFFPNEAELMRHQMKGYGALALLQLPLLIIGAVLCVRHFRESKYRIALVALLVAPVGATLLEPGILRTLAFFGPAGIICMIGLEWLLNRLRGARTAALASLATFGILAAMSLGLLNDALTNGPTWYNDYTLYGMQWGAKQLFVDEIPKLLKTKPGAPVYVTHTWANGTDIFIRFFSLDRGAVQIASMDGWLNKKLPLNPNALFIMSPDEYERSRSSPKFKQVSLVDTIPYPDGRPGFYVARLTYADNVDAVFAAERVAQRQLVTETLTLDGQAVQIAHTRLDMGNLQVMFDGETRTVARGIESNPFILDLKFPTPRTLTGLTGHFGKTNLRVTARLYANNTAQPVEYSADFRYAQAGTDIPAGPAAEMGFERGPATVTRLTLEIAYPESDETAHAHIFDLKLR